MEIEIYVLVLVVGMIVTTVAAWMTARLMRRRIRRALGKRASDAELTSISTWMEVDEAEQRNKQSKPIAPS